MGQFVLLMRVVLIRSTITVSHGICIAMNQLRLATVLVLFLATVSARAADPTVDDALQFAPVQDGVEYDRPTASEARDATIKAEKEGRSTGWVVRGGNGELLRRFADTNADNMVDQWSYFQNGLEVYRDIDGDFDGKADQYRWFHTAGTRWGIDKNEDGRVDSWKQISPHEVAELAVAALASRDTQLFGTLLPSDAELGALGLAAETRKQLVTSIAQARSGFAKFAKEQEAVTSDSRLLDFGATRPGVIPAATGGSTRDVTYYDNVTALVENSGATQQVYLGQLLKVADGWRIVALPQSGDNPSAGGPFTLAASSTPSDPGESMAPNDEMQPLLDQLYKLESQAESATPQTIAKLTSQRAEILMKLADLSPAQQRGEWLAQLADMLSAATATYGYEDGTKQLDNLVKSLRSERADESLIAHVEFRRIWAGYGLAQQNPKADVAKVQAAWLASLERFVNDYPKSDDAAEAMLQLGMGNEFAGETEQAIGWYRKLYKEFRESPSAPKAAGAIRRLDSIGKAIPLTGAAIGGGQVDLRNYRNKVVLIQYWATWCGPCKEDMEQIKQLYARYGRRGFEVIGVNLDSSIEPARQHVASKKIPWKQIADGEGLDGRLANEMGVMTLPLMILVDAKGQVVSRNIHIAEVEPELKRLLAR